MRARAAEIGASGASSGDLHSLFDHHKFDPRTIHLAKRWSLAVLGLSFICVFFPWLVLVSSLLLVLVLPAYFTAYRYLPASRRGTEDSWLPDPFHSNAPGILFFVVTFVPGAIFFAATDAVAAHSRFATSEGYAIAFGLIGAALGNAFFFSFAHKRARYTWEGEK